MTTQTTYRPTQSATTGATFGGLIRLVVGIVGIALVAGWLLSSYRAGGAIPINQPLPVAQDPAVAYTIPTGNPDLPELTFTVETTGRGYNLVDPDGDVFFCESMPASLASLDQCSFVETR
jgi:hypothetical protein